MIFMARYSSYPEVLFLKNIGHYEKIPFWIDSMMVFNITQKHIASQKTYLELILAILYLFSESVVKSC